MFLYKLLIWKFRAGFKCVWNRFCHDNDDDLSLSLLKSSSAVILVDFNTLPFVAWFRHGFLFTPPFNPNHVIFRSIQVPLKRANITLFICFNGNVHLSLPVLLPNNHSFDVLNKVYKVLRGKLQLLHIRQSWNIVKKVPNKWTRAAIK